MKKYIITFLLLWALPALSLAFNEQELVCAIADARLEQVQENFAHGGLGKMELPYGYWYENLAREGSRIRGFDGVVRAWVESPTHLSVLLSPKDYACLRSANGYWVYIGWKLI